MPLFYNTHRLGPCLLCQPHVAQQSIHQIKEGRKGAMPLFYNTHRLGPCLPCQPHAAQRSSPTEEEPKGQEERSGASWLWSLSWFQAGEPRA